MATVLADAEDGVIDPSVHRCGEFEELQDVRVPRHVAFVEMHDVRRAQGANEFARSVGVSVSENNAAAGGVEAADEGLARLTGAVSEDDDFAVESFLGQRRRSEATRIGG